MAEDDKGYETGTRSGAEESAATASRSKTRKSKGGGSCLVAKGRSVSTKRRGIVGPGQEVQAEDFPDGEVRLQQLLDAGILTRE